MSTTTPFAYNTGPTIPGTTQVGSLAVGTTSQDYSVNPGGVKWWMGPDQELGYVIAHPVPSNTQPTQISGVNASVGFNRTTDLTDGSFIKLANIITNQNFTNALTASVWLTNNGYWNSYVAPVLSLDAGNVLSYPGSGTVWTDLVGGKQFNLINGPTYSSSNGGKINFVTSNSQYAECSTSLPDLSTWTISVWHYYTATNSSGSPCIVTEVFPGSTYSINYMLGNGSDTSPWLQAGFFKSGWFLNVIGFALSGGNWYHIVSTYDGSTIKIFINGNLILFNDNVPNTPISSQGGIRLMRRWDLGQYWGGSLATVNIYDRALSQAQAVSQFNATKSRFGW